MMAAYGSAGAGAFSCVVVVVFQGLYIMNVCLYVSM